MLKLALLVLALAVLLLLIWWSAGRPDDGPGDALARRFRERGGWPGGGV